MDISLDDDTFIRGTPEQVYRRLANPSSYATWWPGFRMLRAAPMGETWEAEAIASGAPRPGEPEGRPPVPGQAVFECVLRPRLRPHPRLPWRRLRLTARPYRFRPGKGVFLELRGDVEGTAEWWLEPGWDGVVVHHLARCRVARRHYRPRVAADYRLGLRQGMWGLKDAVQSEVRELAGLAP